MSEIMTSLPSFITGFTGEAESMIKIFFGSLYLLTASNQILWNSSVRIDASPRMYCLSSTASSFVHHQPVVMM